jgi:hypothetical protein
MRRPLAWAVVATANLSAMTLFLWHQSALVVVIAAGRPWAARRDWSRPRREPFG